MNVNSTQGTFLVLLFLSVTQRVYCTCVVAVEKVGACSVFGFVVVHMYLDKKRKEKSVPLNACA